MSLPFIRLEIEGMRRVLTSQLSELVMLQDQQIREIVEEFCTPENLEREIRKRVQQGVADAMDTVVRNAVTKVFMECDGIVRNIQISVEQEINQAFKTAIFKDSSGEDTEDQDGSS